MIAVDTSVWIDALAGRESWQVDHLRQAIRRESPVALPSLVLTEVLQGIPDDRAHDRVADDLLRFVPLDLHGAADHLAAADLYRLARRRGITVRSTIDCLIATVCIRERVPLLHRDRDFDHLARVSDLVVVARP